MEEFCQIQASLCICTVSYSFIYLEELSNLGLSRYYKSTYMYSTFFICTLLGISMHSATDGGFRGSIIQTSMMWWAFACLLESYILKFWALNYLQFWRSNKDKVLGPLFTKPSCFRGALKYDQNPSNICAKYMTKMWAQKNWSYSNWSIPVLKVNLLQHLICKFLCDIAKSQDQVKCLRIFF